MIDNRVANEGLQQPGEQIRQLLNLEFVRLLGKGKFAEVVHVRRSTDGLEFALKLYKVCPATCHQHNNGCKQSPQCDPTTKRHAKAEATILRQISHPYIVRMAQSLVEECRPSAIMLELVRGEELFHLCNSVSRMPLEWVVFCAAELLCAILYLHKRHIVYRDIKLENVMIDNQGHVKLVDFGFAKRLIRDRTFTTCGTPEYMAPEIFSSRGYGTAVDMWALGVLIYELMTSNNLRRASSGAGTDSSSTAPVLSSGPSRLRWPTHFDTYTTDIIGGLLCIDERKRLTAQDATHHKWFAGLDWGLINNRGVSPPWQDHIHAN